jgi:hypothetical protein
MAKPGESKTIKDVTCPNCRGTDLNLLGQSITELEYIPNFKDGVETTTNPNYIVTTFECVNCRAPFEERLS